MSSQALLPQENPNTETAQKGRLLLISNLALGADRANKGKNNRKAKKVCELFDYDGVEYTVNGKGKGIYKELMAAVIEQLKIALSTHKRVLVIRFDLHSHNFGKNSTEISTFIEQIKLWVKRRHLAKDTGHVWVREQEKAKKQHYHLALFIDGDKIRNSKNLLQVIRDKWEAKDPSNHTMPFIKNPHYFIDNNEVLHDAVYRLSYLAKVRGKGYRPEQAKDYSASRLKLANRKANQ